MRKSCDVFIYIDSEKAMKAGITFQKSANGVILTSGNDQGKIPVDLIAQATTRDGKDLLKAAS